MAGKSVKKSATVLKDTPVWRRCTPASTSAAATASLGGGEDVVDVGAEVYSRARDCRTGSGIEPFRWAWSSALGRCSRKESWEDVRARRAASAGARAGGALIDGWV
jgi:hypothetical protein